MYPRQVSNEISIQKKFFETSGISVEFVRNMFQPAMASVQIINTPIAAFPEWHTFHHICSRNRKTSSPAYFPTRLQLLPESRRWALRHWFLPGWRHQKLSYEKFRMASWHWAANVNETVRVGAEYCKFYLHHLFIKHLETHEVYGCYILIARLM